MDKKIFALYVMKIDLSDAVWIKIEIKHLTYLNQRSIPEQTVVFIDIQFQISSKRFKEERNKGVPLSWYRNRWLLNANRGIDRVIFHWFNWPVETNHRKPPHIVTEPTWINLTSPGSLAAVVQWYSLRNSTIQSATALTHVRRQARKWQSLLVNTWWENY